MDGFVASSFIIYLRKTEEELKKKCRSSRGGFSHVPTEGMPGMGKMLLIIGVGGKRFRISTLGRVDRGRQIDGSLGTGLGETVSLRLPNNRDTGTPV